MMIERTVLENYLSKNMTTREIGKLLGVNNTTVLYWMKKYGLKGFYSNPEYNINFFNHIDTKEKAYILGFLMGDGCITKDGKLAVSIALEDREVLDFISEHIGCNVRTYLYKNIEQARFPSANIKIGNQIIMKNLKMLFGGRLKKERRFPIIKKELEPFLVQGFFDAEGCVTFGHRKDREKVWQKISFTSQLKMLEGMQKILIKYDIPTIIRPKSKEDCFVMEICAAKQVLKTLDVIYSNTDFIVLKRKYNKSIALRLELGEFGESYNKNSQYRAEPTELEGVETRGDIAIYLNDLKSTQA